MPHGHFEHDMYLKFVCMFFLVFVLTGTEKQTIKSTKLWPNHNNIHTKLYLESLPLIFTQSILLWGKGGGVTL